MNIEIGEFDGKIGVFIIRLACGLFGLALFVSLSAGFVSWLRDSSAYTSIWNALVGDEPYCRLVGKSVCMGGGRLWKMTPDGMVPAFFDMGLSVLLLCAAIFNRLWIYLFVAALLFVGNF